MLVKLSFTSYGVLSVFFLQIQDIHASALGEDPNIFDYDAVYDEMQQAKVVPRQQERQERRPRYIAAILEQTERRKKEQDITYERQLLKERKKEDHLYEDKEQFVTSAYRKKLEEDKKWQERERMREEQEAREGVAKKGMAAFYFSSMTKNVAFRNAEDPKVDAPGASESEAVPKGQDEDKIGDEMAAGLDEYDALRLAAERAWRESRTKKLEVGAAGEVVVSEAGDGGEATLVCPADSTHEGPSGGLDAVSAEAECVQEGNQGAKRRNDEDKVAAARERFLSRKRQAVG